MSTSMPEVVSTVADLRRRIGVWRQAGETVALVPTMGALHAGHLSLVSLGQRRCRRTVTSIFVNPTQFAPTEDFSKYPRTFDDDCAMLGRVGCDLVWAPTAPVMYPEGFATRVVPAGAAEGLETDFRPHFFGGVATVCSKLFLQTGADVAVFGEKDYQQLCVIRQVVRDLDMPVEILGGPTVREPDGLAMSSRNRYLSPDQRARAVVIHDVIRGVAAAAATGGHEAAIAEGEKALAAAGFRQIDYVTVRDAETLKAWHHGSGRPARVLAAAWLGETRLIDNVGVATA
ncbi:MAG: pantoate--beta-alanine ligase [Hyphomicrobiaceae bacterium]|nr:pantoate--beta-alanine ligase [Hyphomicrobiaceae bacterium]